MPKKYNKSAVGNRRPKGNNDFNKHYFGHDDRGGRIDGPHLSSRPRVSFKPQARSKFRIQNFEEDISMLCGDNAEDNNNRQVVIRGGRFSPRPRNNGWPNRGRRAEPPARPKPTLLGEANWYKISIPYGHKYSKDYIITTLLSYVQPETFDPIMYKVIGTEAIFYVDDQKTASKLLSSDRKITANDGFKLIIKVKPGFPQCEIDDTLKERLKLAMSKRYVVKTNALDLSKFHRDPDLINDYFCALFRPVMLMSVLDIVSEHIPNLEALNLDGNKLHIIERLNILNTKFPNLKILYIGDNKIREINQIDVIKDLKLEELRLAGNPVCSKYKTRQSDYISDVRKRFPKLLRLDGIELPKPILFDVADDGVKLPPTNRMFVANAKVQDVASQFLQQYFAIFDSENRQPLLDAYHEHACFSLTVSYAHNTNKFNPYLAENRNLFRSNDPNKRRKLLKQGRLPVVSFISELPRTTHNLNTFTMDISLVADTMMLITVTGLFKELDNRDQPNRYFNRTFIIVPEGTGYCIRNEQLHINQPTESQEKQASAVQIPAAQPPATPSTSGAAPLAATAITTSQLTEDVKQQMTLTLSQQTNMNLEWSLKCLEEVQWNYNNALAAFQEFFKRGQVPPEAFKK
ncbi:nuclear RNA export factor 1-like [Prorops nasuta]|uniref:nuclear RNA export factor 1-like n=1 Tax=Prorops nasuta TaxID=863751 RepID=UPI0034D0129F